MPAASHSDTESSATIVERSFHAKLPVAPQLAELSASLQQHEGILAVIPNPTDSQVRIRYDVRHWDFTQIQALLTQLGATAHTGLWQRWRSGWFVNMDNNIRDNARHHPVCCSKPPVVSVRHKDRQSSK